MVMEITNNYSSVYESTYAAQKQQISKQQAVSKTETKDAVTAQKKAGATADNSDYFNTLTKLAPSVDCRIGTTYATAKSGKTLTIDPRLLEKMQNDPEFEKEMKELIKGVEMMTKFSESLNKATGWTTVFRHSYIDENGKYSHFAVIRNDFMYNMSDKLREERRKNSDKLIAKINETTAKRKEELQEALEEKKAAKGKKQTGKAEKLIKDKIAASKDGRIYMDDTGFREILDAMKEDSAEKVKDAGVVVEISGGNGAASDKVSSINDNVSFYGATVTKEQSEKLQDVITQLEEQGGGNNSQSWNLGSYAQLGLKTSQLAYACKEMGLFDDVADQITGAYKAQAEEKINTLNNLMNTVKKFAPVVMDKLYNVIKENDPEAYKLYKERAASRENQLSTIELNQEAGNALFDIFSNLDISSRDNFKSSFEKALAGFGEFFPDDMADAWKQQQDALMKRFLSFLDN